MLQLDFIGSGSSGNATLIRWADTRLLLDCGLPVRTLRERLADLDTRIEDLSAVVIPHEHNDHVTGLGIFTKRPPLPVYLSERTSQAVRTGKRSICELRPIGSSQQFSIGSLKIQSFPVSHDAGDAVGCVFQAPDGTRLGIATDLGRPNPMVIKALKNCHLIGLECNHDPDLLRDGPYPWFLKRRIKSDKGHLSNQAAADLLGQIAGPNLRHLFALHLSKTNNRPKLVRQLLTSRLKQLGLSTEVTITHPDRTVSFPPKGQIDLL